MKISNVNSADHPQIRVAILEDNKSEQIGLRTQLSEEPDIKVVSITGEPPEFLNSIQDDQIQVAIIDLRMAIYDSQHESVHNLTGFKILEKLKEPSSNPKKTVKCLVLTNHDGLPELLACIDAGAEGFARKVSHQQPELADLIRTLASGNHYYPSDMVGELAKYIDKERLIRGDVRLGSHDNPLSRQERKVLALAGDNDTTNEQIAKELNITENTVKTHLQHCYNKTGRHDRLGAYELAAINGWLDPDTPENFEGTEK